MGNNEKQKQLAAVNGQQRNWLRSPRTWTRRFTVIFVAVVLFIIAAIVGLVLGLVLGLHHKDTKWATTGSKTLPSFPLAVKSPYLSAWVPGDQVHDVATAQPEFWTGKPLNWPILARVDNETYSLFGAAAFDGAARPMSAATTSITYTSSHTYISLTAGKAEITLDFFSPVLPGKADYARQWLPYSYLTVSVSNQKSWKGTVEIFSAIDQTWTGQDGASHLNFTTSGEAGFFQFYNPDAVDFTEHEQMASYGSVLFGTRVNGAMTQTCGSAASVYSYFDSHGNLPNGTSSCSGSDMAALSMNLGTSFLPESATFVVGFDREHVVHYLDSTIYTGYYRTVWPTVGEAMGQVVGDYNQVLSQSLDLDNQVRSKAEAVSNVYGSQYADIVEASVRQAFAGLELTVPLNNLTASPWAFIKEISTDGNINTIDLQFQSWPIFACLSPEYIMFLLEPTLNYLTLGDWPHPWVVHDLGRMYPNATGHNDGRAEQMPLFETSTLFILMHVYAKLTGDNTYVQRYSSLLDKHAAWLAENSLYPDVELISVDTIRPTGNQTGLAVQSAIGLNAASILTGNTTYSSIAASHAQKIYDDGLGLNGPNPASSTHFTFDYQNATTWSIMFPAFSDKFLNLSTFPQSAWDMQSAWYLQNMGKDGLAFVGPENDTEYFRDFGPPGDTQHQRHAPFMLGVTDWNIVTAAASSDAVREAVVNTTYAYLTNGMNNVPFGTFYAVEGPESGKWVRDKAKSTVGSHFAILAMEDGWWYNSTSSS